MREHALFGDRFSQNSMFIFGIFDQHLISYRFEEYGHLCVFVHVESAR